jgi:hypothetical protein
MAVGQRPLSVLWHVGFALEGMRVEKATGRE